METYVTERGITIQVMPIPLLLDKIRASHTDTPLPTYTEKLAGGGKQRVPITPEMAEAWQATDPETWAEHAEKWAAYQADRDARMARLNDALWRAVLRQAIILDMPAGKEWIAEQESYGIQVPDDLVDRKAHYIWTQVIGGTRDILRIMGMAAGANLTEEQVRDAEASFWNTLQRPAAR